MFRNLTGVKITFLLNYSILITCQINLWTLAYTRDVTNNKALMKPVTTAHAEKRRTTDVYKQKQ